MNETVKKLFGEEALTFAEFLNRAEQSGVKIGNLTEAEENHRKELDGIRISHALAQGLEKAGVKNGELVKKAIDMNAVTVEDGKVRGLDEQIAALRASDPYLFREKETAKTGGEHGGGSADPDGMTDAEFYKARMKSL